MTPRPVSSSVQLPTRVRHSKPSQETLRGLKCVLGVQPVVASVTGTVTSWNHGPVSLTDVVPSGSGG